MIRNYKSSDMELDRELVRGLSDADIELLVKRIKKRNILNTEKNRLDVIDDRWDKIPTRERISLIDEVGHSGYSEYGSKTFTVVGVYLDDGKVLRDAYDLLNPGPENYRYVELKGRRVIPIEAMVVKNAMDLSGSRLYGSTLLKDDMLSKTERKGSDIHNMLFDETVSMINADNVGLNRYYFDEHTALNEEEIREKIAKITNSKEQTKVAKVESRYEPLMQMADIPIHYYGRIFEKCDYGIYQYDPAIRGMNIHDSNWKFLWNENKKKSGNCTVTTQCPSLYSITPDEKKSDSEYIKSSQKRGMKEHKKERDHDGSDTKFRKSRIFKNKKPGNCGVQGQSPTLHSITPDEKKSDSEYIKSSQKRGMKEHKKERDHDKLNTASRRFKKLFGKR